MPVPEMTEHGLLPAGVHDCTTTEAALLFCGNERRQEIWAGFQRFMGRVATLPNPSEILLDGSFVTDKANPKDVDVVVDITGCNDNERNLWIETYRDHHNQIHQNDYVDFYPVVAGHGHDFSAFFQYIRPKEALDRGVDPTVRKGILRIVP